MMCFRTIAILLINLMVITFVMLAPVHAAGLDTAVSGLKQKSFTKRLNAVAEIAATGDQRAAEILNALARNNEQQSLRLNSRHANLHGVSDRERHPGAQGLGLPSPPRLEESGAAASRATSPASCSLCCGHWLPIARNLAAPAALRSASPVTVPPPPPIPDN